MFDDGANLDRTDSDDADDSLPLRELQRIAGGACTDCRTAFTAREAVYSIALGFKNAPRCAHCLSQRLNRSPADLTAQLHDYVHRRECYTRAWKKALEMDHTQTDSNPVITDGGQPMATSPDASGPAAESVVATEHWDAGAMGCGELVMGLRQRLNALPPGTVIEVTATDPAAPEDIPSWCRLTGHTLKSYAHPRYLIQRKGS